MNFIYQTPLKAKDVCSSLFQAEFPYMLLLCKQNTTAFFASKHIQISVGDLICMPSHLLIQASALDSSANESIILFQAWYFKEIPVLMYQEMQALKQWFTLLSLGLHYPAQDVYALGLELQNGIFQHHLSSFLYIIEELALLHAYTTLHPTVPQFGQCNYRERQIMEDVQAYILAHYKAVGSLAEASKALRISPVRLSQIVKKQTGKTFSCILNQARVQVSKSLLLDPKLSIEEVAVAVGFDSEMYFRKQFKLHVQVLPSAYRKQPKG